MGTGGLEGATLTAIGSAVVAFVASVATYSWRARGLYSDLEKKIDVHRDEILRNTGEGLAALRQKAVDMEIWNRDNFVRKTEFQNAVDSFTRSIDSLRSDMNSQYARLSDKMDQVIQGKVGPTAPHR
jgi:hypothetical protein